MDCRTWAALAVSLMAANGCSESGEPEPVEIELSSTERAFEPLEYDTGWIELSQGVSVLVVSRLEAEIEHGALVLARGQALDPQPESGTFTVRGTLSVEMFADIDVQGQTFEGSVGSASVTVETDVATYDPFLIREALVPLLNAQEPGEVTFQDGPFTYRVQNGYSFLPTLEGVCVGIDEEEEVMQYVNQLTWTVDYGHSIWVGIETPLGAPSTLAEGGFSFEATVVPSRQFDLGSYSLTDGRPVDGVTPCGEVVDGMLQPVG
jgi:hypothetical protein